MVWFVTNTGTAKVASDITGTQISSPFDVSGTFNYGADGYWVNTRGVEYGNTLPATKVVATVVLANGKTVTAENTQLVGNPSTIYGTTTPPAVTTPHTKKECKNGGWKTFTAPHFKNQGQCVKFVKHQHHHGHDGYDKHHDREDDEQEDKRRD